MNMLNWLEKHLPGVVWDNLATVSILGLCVVLSAGFYLIVHNNNAAIANNNQRITDIQAQRVASCRQTYEGVREVLRPFFPPPQVRTPRQQRDLDKFNRTVDRLKVGCATQTKGGLSARPPKR